MLVSDIVYALAVDLNDAAPGHEFTTWSRSQLTTYVIEAVQTTFSERPDLFIETKIMEVEPCTELQEACDCTKVRRVIGQATADGRVLKKLRIRSSNDKLKWPGPSRDCGSYSNFSLSEYSIDEGTNRIWLYPRVPPGISVYVLIECAVIPSSVGSDYDVPSELVAAVKQWALYRAKAVDEEINPNVAQVAENHQATFWRLIQAQRDSEDIIAGQDDGRS